MLSKILGIISILTGLFWLIKPESLKNRLAKKMSKKVRWIVYGFVLVFGFLLIGSAFKTPGILGKIVVIVGMVLAIKAILLITSKTSDKIFEWWSNKPVIVFRIWAGIIFIFGIFLFMA